LNQRGEPVYVFTAKVLVFQSPVRVELMYRCTSGFVGPHLPKAESATKGVGARPSNNGPFAPTKYCVGYGMCDAGHARALRCAVAGRATS
jgi:hypothetical protein